MGESKMMFATVTGWFTVTTLGELFVSTNCATALAALGVDGEELIQFAPNQSPPPSVPH
jgi:hypothetical protein